MGRTVDTAESSNSLTVRDNRTGKVFNVPYVSCYSTGIGCNASLDVFRIVDNSIQATAFKAMAAPRAPGEREENETDKGLRVADRGFLNTAVLRSQITFIDGEAGSEYDMLDLTQSAWLIKHGTVLRYRCACNLVALSQPFDRLLLEVIQSNNLRFIRHIWKRVLHIHFIMLN